MSDTPLSFTCPYCDHSIPAINEETAIAARVSLMPLLNRFIILSSCCVNSLKTVNNGSSVHRKIVSGNA